METVFINNLKRKITQFKRSEIYFEPGENRRVIEAIPDSKSK
jgi:hypothetical protein